MKVIGSKFWGQDSSLCVLDFEKNEIFSVNADRVSRIKKDNFDISAILSEFNNQIIDPDVIASPFNTFDGHDTCLENKGTSYFWLNFQKILRKIEKPKYYSDLKKKKSIFKKILIFFYILPNIKFFYHYFFWKYYMKKYLNGKLNVKKFHLKYCTKYIQKLLKKINKKKINPIFYDHHTSHSASAYYLSNFFKNNEESYVFTLDQQGDHTFSTLFYFNDLYKKELSRSFTKRAKIDNTIHIISIATVYSLFTKTLGFRENCDEGKVEALAAYGKPDEETLNKLNNIIFLANKDKKIVFDNNKEKFIEFFNKKNLELLLKKIGNKNFSSTVQTWLENIVVNYLNKALPPDKKVNLCLAGGVVANVILNHKIYEKCKVNKIYICPPMGDEGAALGSAFLASIEKKLDIKKLLKNSMPYWGPSYTKEMTLEILKKK